MTFDEMKISVLERENDLLRERIAFLQANIIQAGPRYDLLGLTGMESRMLAALAGGALRSKEQLLAIVYSDRLDQDLPEIKIIDVWICKLRSKLQQHEVSIETAWGSGYALSPVSVSRLRDVLAPFGGLDLGTPTTNAALDDRRLHHG